MSFQTSQTGLPSPSSPSALTQFPDPTLLPVAVGPPGNSHTFYVNKPKAMLFSQFFRDAFGPRNVGGGADGKLELRDERRDIFIMFLHWMEVQESPGELKNEVCNWMAKGIYQMEKGERDIVSAEKLTELYIFAHHLVVLDLKRTILAVAVGHFNTCAGPTHRSIGLAFAHIPSKNRYLQLLVDAHCLNWNPRNASTIMEFAHRVNELPSRFLEMTWSRFAEVAEKKSEQKGLRYWDYYEDKVWIGQPSTGQRRIAADRLLFPDLKTFLLKLAVECPRIFGFLGIPIRRTHSTNYPKKAHTSNYSSMRTIFTETQQKMTTRTDLHMMICRAASPGRSWRSISLFCQATGRKFSLKLCDYLEGAPETKGKKNKSPCKKRKTAP
ncbi:hypothetical protein K458DRAFT_396113 [Lentithecium fluviatile CBS 122367]|uniref:BTB domain-containing protein n=1 Tax=Lentithecium fluviatile CBS 122367 TaxID=1168545 RepID=A0A6G1IG64_9PLEO|nr:hypothetical protein K458DRAFT_396113 [Lentithecium fluviatile CBS 122367]